MRLLTTSLSSIIKHHQIMRDKESTLPNLGRPFGNPSSIEQREDTILAENAELASNKQELYGRLPVAKDSFGPVQTGTTTAMARYTIE